MCFKGSIILLFLINWCAGPGLQAQPVAYSGNSYLADKRKADSLLQLVPWYFLKAKFDSVDLCLKTGLPYAERSGDPDLLAGYYLMKANVSSIRGNFRAGLVEAGKAGPYISKATPYPLHIKYFMSKANCFSSLDAADSAIFYYQLAEKYNREKLPYGNWSISPWDSYMFWQMTIPKPRGIFKKPLILPVEEV